MDIRAFLVTTAILRKRGVLRDNSSMPRPAASEVGHKKMGCTEVHLRLFKSPNAGNSADLQLSHLVRIFAREAES
jgi:hypothetical protein